MFYAFPDFSAEGYSKDDVEAFCSKYNLNCTYKEQATNTYAEGKIISQSRLVGSAISKGSSLTVTYAVKPKVTPSVKTSPDSDDSDTSGSETDE